MKQILTFLICAVLLIPSFDGVGIVSAGAGHAVFFIIVGKIGVIGVRFSSKKVGKLKPLILNRLIASAHRVMISDLQRLPESRSSV